jgi:hypothetical protein
VTTFHIYCPCGDATYDEVTAWLLENLPGVGRWSLIDRDVFGMSMTPNVPMRAGRIDIEVQIPDDTDAVRFKLRFADELERAYEADAYRSALTTALSAQFQNQIMGSLGISTLPSKRTTVTAAQIEAQMGAWEKKYGKNVYLSGWDNEITRSDPVGKSQFTSRVDFVIRPRNMDLYNGSIL